METKLTIAKSVVIYDEAILQGNITIGENTIIHPNCRILAITGPIIIGENNIIEEKVLIENNSKDNINNNQMIMTIGNRNLIRVGTKIRSKFIGNNNVFEPQSILHIESRILNNCIIGSHVEIISGKLIDNNTIIIKLSNNNNNNNNKYIYRKQHKYFIESHNILIDLLIEAYHNKQK